MLGGGDGSKFKTLKVLLAPRTGPGPGALAPRVTTYEHVVFRVAQVITRVDLYSIRDGVRSGPLRGLAAWG